MPHLVTVRGKTPRVHPTAFVAPTATLVGDVVVAARANIWFGAVVRGDKNAIRIGERASIQDNAVLHCNDDRGTIIGTNVTVGHAAVLEGCEIHDHAMIGMNASVLDGAIVEEGALVAAGSVVRENDRVPAWTLTAGVPAKPRKKLGEEARQEVREAADRYQSVLRLYTHLREPPADEG